MYRRSSASLTDDDVLEDVGVVVRCGRHLDSVGGETNGVRLGFDVHTLSEANLCPSGRVCGTNRSDRQAARLSDSPALA